MITFLLMKIMKTELLAPAGSLAGLKAVIAAGADAVYIGGTRFGARAYADNPGEEDLLGGIDYAHLRGVRVYLTVNTLLKEREMSELGPWLLPYVRRGIDAVLVQDFGVLRYLREQFPSLPLHASTQMTVTGPAFASLLKKYGVTRVVPARELSVRELVRIREESGVEVETFVHGALCYCYSGQCLLSSLIGGRSGNRGRCAQPCRLLGLLNDRRGFDGKTSILERPDARHFLSPKDLCAIDLLPELVSSGIDSLKIEGRMKQPEYAAGVVSVYRAALDRLSEADKKKDAFRVTEEEHRKLYDLYNRNGFTDGYFHRYHGPEMMAQVKHVLTREETDARHALYEKMHALYMTEEMTLPAEAEITVRAGEPVAAVLSCGGVRIREEGAAAEPALSRPLSEERIRENVAKTGGTDFHLTKIRVETDGNSFVPMSALNEVRRNAFRHLKEELLGPCRRQAEVPQPYAASSSQTKAEEPLRLHVVAADAAHVQAALRESGVGRIYAEAAYLLSDPDPVKAAVRFIRQCREAGKEAGIAMPRIERAGHEAKELKEAAEDLLAEGLDVFLVRCPETLAFFSERGLCGCVQADAGLYTYNAEAKAFLTELGVRGDTAPVELNRGELSGRDNKGSEIIAYGMLPLMVSAQCLKKNTGHCTHGNGTMTLTDRTGTKFSVKCECVFCYNILYNYLPLSLLSETETLRRMHFSAIRLDFSSESGREAQQILRTAAEALRGREVCLPGKTTKGHFLRGVE